MKNILMIGTGDTIAVDGVVTLREAITAAENNVASGDAPAGQPFPVIDAVQFNIAGPGPHVIVLGSSFTFSDPLSITGPLTPGTARRPSTSRSWRAASSSLTTMGT